jgi:hypothetical protein
MLTSKGLIRYERMLRISRERLKRSRILCKSMITIFQQEKIQLFH